MIFKQKFKKVDHLIFPFFLFCIKSLCRDTSDEVTHVFVTKTFFYEKANLYDKETNNLLVMLFNMDKGLNSIEQLHKGSACITYTTKNGWSWHAARIDGLFGKDQTKFGCGISTYRLTCSNLILDPELEEIDQSVYVKISRKFQPFKITLKTADNVPRKIVICPNQLIAFEQWHLFITAMELYRMHKVDLVLIYIQSVDKDIYKMMKVYQQSGLLQLRPALEMPKFVLTMGSNPNMEIFWQNQLANFQECLYEFRESAEFIAFPDWDEFMFTKDRKISYYTVLRKIADNYPMMNAFAMVQYKGAHESLEQMTKNQHNIVDFWRVGIKFSKKEMKAKLAGNTFYRTNSVLFGGINFAAKRVKNDYHEIQIPKDDLYSVNAKNSMQQHLNDHIENTIPLEKNFEKFIKHHNQSISILWHMPKEEVLTKELKACHQRLEQSFEKSTSMDKCWNYHQCKTEKVRTGCVNVENNWEHINLPLDDKGALQLFILRDNAFLSSEICLF